MHVDLDSLVMHPSFTPAAVQLCIVGAGIAGLVLCSELLSAGLSVALIEAGGFDLEERSQSLYQAEMPGTVHRGTIEGRFRTFGGSSIRWGGQLLPYPEDIFCPVPGAPSRPWPISASELQPFYSRVLQIFQVEDLPFEADLLAHLGQPPLPTMKGLNLRFSKWSPFGRRNLAGTLGRKVLENPNVTVYTHANACALEGSNGRMERLRVLDYSGKEYWFHADRFILCGGTVESSRLLLLSPGIRDVHQQIGKGFNDHVSLHAAVLPPTAKKAVQRKLGPFFQRGVLYTPKLEATSELQRDKDLLAVMAHFTIEEPETSGIAAVRNLLTSLQRRRVRVALTANLLPMLRALPDVARLAWTLKVHKRRALSSRAIMRLNIDLEQDPDANNRISLSQQRDALGIPKAVVQWSVSARETQTVRNFLPVLQEAFRSLGLPDFNWNPEVVTGGKIILADTYHAMGGVCMGRDPRSSVVDTDLKVHGVENLFVASCAVFPSGGSSNPTFTLMALAMRLAEHLVSPGAYRADVHTTGLT